MDSDNPLVKVGFEDLMTKQILEFIQRKPKKTYSLREISRQLRLDKSEAHDALELLVTEGKLVLLDRKHYQLPGLKSERGFEAKLQGHPAGFAFAIPTNPQLADLYIPKGHSAGAWHGDLVQVERRPPGRDGKPWGVVTQVLERANTRVVGRLFFSKGFAWLDPDDVKLPNLKLKPDGLEGIEAGSRLSVKVQFPEQGKKAAGDAYGELLAYLGEGDAPEVEAEAVIAKYELLQVFSSEALAEAERVGYLSEEEVSKRTDFRNLRVFTIDGADAKDYDDAIHIETLASGNFRVGIHIADVSHYVKEFSPLDRDAYDRATSVYLPGKVLPMLPERLSNGICSLVPGEDRLVLSVVAELTPSGKVKDYRFYEGVIRSAARLTYTWVEAFAEGGSLPEAGDGKREATEVASSHPLPAIRLELENDLKLLLQLTQTLKARRHEKGALDFHFTEVKVEVDSEGNLHLIPQAEPRARSLIEELMLLANRMVAKHLSEREVPALFRIHEDPSEQQFAKLGTSLGKLGYAIPGGELTPKALQSVLKKAEGKPESPVISTLLLRSLRLARYAAENLGHFGLAAEHYLHFTSPIRRYPDLVVHRVLRTLMRKKITPKRKEDWAARFPKIAEHTSERERAAENAERELTKYYQCVWAEKHKGEVYSGTVSGVTGFGVFVSLSNGVEGMIRLGTLEDDHYEYLEDILALEGRRSKRRIRIGDEMEIEIQGANPAARQIDFAPTEKFYQQEAPQAGQGKSAKKGLAVKAEPKVKTEPKAKSGKSRRVVGPPESKKGFSRPIKVTAGKVYFGAWGEEEQTSESKPSLPQAKSPSKAGRSDGKRNSRRRRR